MNTIPIENIQIATTIIVCTCILIFLLIYRIKYPSIYTIIKKQLQKNFISFKDISESQFVGIPDDSGVRFHSVPIKDQIIVFSISYHVDIKTIVNIIRNGLEDKGYKTITVVRSKGGWILKTQRKKISMFWTL